MKFDKKTIISTILTLFILILITILIKVSIDEWKKSKQEGLQYYGDETKTLEAPLPYKTIMENIKYPDPNDPIYDIGNETYNNLLFNKNDKSMHFSDEQIMKDMKHFNNASNILLEHYLNNNVPSSTDIQIQDLGGNVSTDSILDDSDISENDYYNNIMFKKESVANNQPSYLYDDDNRIITHKKTYMYRISEDYDPTGTTPPSNGMYMLKRVTDVNGVREEDNIYNYDYTYNISGTALNYTDVYDQLTKYNESSFDNIVSMTKPGKYSSHYFESNYGDLSGNVTKDFKHFYSAAHTLAGHGLFNKR